MTPRFTLNYGLGGSTSRTTELRLDRLQLWRRVRQRPQSDEEGTRTRRRPALRIHAATSVRRSRGGAGLFYDTQLGWWRLGERPCSADPDGSSSGNAAVTNPLTGQPFSTAHFTRSRSTTDVPAAAPTRARSRRRSILARATSADSVVEAGDGTRCALPARVPDGARCI
jgi:hypothetical protein